LTGLGSRAWPDAVALVLILGANAAVVLLVPADGIEDITVVVALMTKRRPLRTSWWSETTPAARGKSR